MFTNRLDDEIHQLLTDVRGMMHHKHTVWSASPVSLNYRTLRGKTQESRGALFLIYTTCAGLIIFLNAYNHNKLAAHCGNKKTPHQAKTPSLSSLELHFQRHSRNDNTLIIARVNTVKRNKKDLLKVCILVMKSKQWLLQLPDP